ncbi:MAG: FkbM family methyltransferase [Planctomycetota bacterium]|nr:FkbM family methyltransferase [Planctomycetota bacterium]
MNTLLVNKNGIILRVLKTEHEQFWSSLTKGEWEPETFEIFDRFITRDFTYLDIGAWIGPTLLYASHFAKEAYGFEPDPIAFNELAANLKLNSKLNNVKIYQTLIGNINGKVRFGNRHSCGDSQGSILFADRQTSWEVDSVRLENVVQREKIQPPLFIKIDIEGGEYSLVPSLKKLFRDTRPIVYLSLHPSFFFMSLYPGSTSLIKRILRRIKYVVAHMRLVMSLRAFRHIYDSHGNEINVFKSLVNVIFVKDMVEGNSILAMD